MPELEKLSIDTQAPVVAVTNAVNSAANTAQKAASSVTKDLPKKSHHKFLILALPILLGVVTGFAFNKYIFPPVSQTNKAAANIDSATLKVGDVIGASDKGVFKDEAQGYLEKGGLNGEGSHKLLRTGGDSQTVYLTSSVVDLDALVGNEVNIWGETFGAQKVGWLMDVGRVEILKLNADKPE